MLFMSKCNERGQKVNNLVYHQNLWKKIYLNFFPQDFSDEELELIEKKLKQIFDILRMKKYGEKLGVVSIYIKMVKKKITIRIVNQLDYFCDNMRSEIFKSYDRIKACTNSSLNIKGDKNAEIELLLEL